jgi:hypothetical protein
MAIALAEADKYEILEKIGKWYSIWLKFFMQSPLTDHVSSRLWLLRYHS